MGTPEQQEFVKQFYSRSQEHILEVITRFACPEGYTEINRGYEGTAFDRCDVSKEVTIKPANSLNDDKGNVIVTNCSGLQYETPSYWYVRKV